MKQVLLLLLLPLLSLAATTCKTGKTGLLGTQCGYKKGPSKKVTCEEDTSCQQRRNKKGKLGSWFCLPCLGEGRYVKMEGLRMAPCCSGLKMKDGHCYKDSTHANPYCALSQEHTMCKYPGVGSTCPAERESGFTDEGKKLIVDKHNELRSRVARGEEAGQPKASNMWALKWSDELATVAQRWADQCTFAHDKNRKKLDCTRVGQNAWIGLSDTKQTKDEVMATMNSPVQSWYKEVTKAPFSSSNIEPFQSTPGLVTGHYTQVVWADTMEIGCGWTYWQERGRYRSMVQCNYAIAGNMKGAAMYMVGEPCSSCPDMCNSEGLCQVPFE